MKCSICRLRIPTARLEIAALYNGEWQIEVSTENCALLGCYAGSSRNFLPTFRDNLSVPSGFKNPLRLGPIGCLETSVRNYHYSLRNKAEERSSQLLCGGSRVAIIISSEELKSVCVKYLTSRSTKKLVHDVKCMS